MTLPMVDVPIPVQVVAVVSVIIHNVLLLMIPYGLLVPGRVDILWNGMLVTFMYVCYFVVFDLSFVGWILLLLRFL